MVVSRVGTFTTLVCTDKTATGAVSINWMVQLPGTEQWKLVFSANEKKEFSGGASKDSMQLTDHNFQDTGVFSLLFRAQMEDRGLYSCLVKQQRQVLKEWFILLVILTGKKKSIISQSNQYYSSLSRADFGPQGQFKLENKYLGGQSAFIYATL